MSFLRNLWTDLVEKRLWPVAIVLLLALVAAPVVLLSTGGDADAELPVAGAGVTGATGAVVAEVSAAPAAPVRLDRAGKTRNPFAQQHVPRPAATGVTGATGAKAAATRTATAARTASRASTTTATVTPAPARSTTTPTRTPAPIVKPKLTQEAFTVQVRIHQVGRPAVRRDVAHLTPLPSAVNPFFVYLGVLNDKRSAVFLLSSDVAKVTGKGVCKPLGSDCETVELKAGQKERFAVLGDDAKTVLTYELELVRVLKAGVDTTAHAASAHPSKAQAAATRVGAKAAAASFGTLGYRVDPHTGLLVRRAATPR